MRTKSIFSKLIFFITFLVFLTSVLIFPQLPLQIAGYFSDEIIGQTQQTGKIDIPPVQTNQPFRSSRRLTHLSLLIDQPASLIDALVKLSNFLKTDEIYDQTVFLISPEMIFTLPDDLNFPKPIDIIKVEKNWSAEDLQTRLARLATEKSLIIKVASLPPSTTLPELEKFAQLHAENWYDNFDLTNSSIFKYLNNEKSLYQVFLSSAAKIGSKKVSIVEKNKQFKLTAFYQGETFPTKIVTLQFMGDVMLGRFVRTLMEKNSLDYPFEKMPWEFWRSADLTIANLEGPVTENPIKTSKAIAFNFSPDIGPLLSKYGFDLLSLANNHALDMGSQGLTDSYQNLLKNNLIPFGHPRGWEKETVVFKKINGLSFAFVGLNDVDFKLKKPVILKEISRLAADGHHVIPFLHWGVEYQHQPQKSQIEFAHSLIDSGAFMVVGAHPHVVQSVEIYRNKPIFYSLGNTVFDQYFSKETQEGLTFNLRISPENLEIYLFPIKITRSQMILKEGEERAEFLQRLEGWSDLAEPWKSDILTGKITLQIEKK